MIISIDTSNYTTSMAIVHGEDIILDERIPITVKKGMRGIRQSDAFFQHINNLERLIETHLPQYVDDIQAVAVSTRPRPVGDSYMPVFRAGTSMAKTIASAIKVPIFETSHQEGHLFSALYKHQLPDEFLFFHISGGTTELHRVNAKVMPYDIDMLMHTADINFGQLIDRIGVKAGLDFPCGARMNELAKPSPQHIQTPKFKYNQAFNLSGYENYFTNLLTSQPHAYVYHTLFTTIGNIIYQLVNKAVTTHTCNHVLIAGGVAENTIIRKQLETLTYNQPIHIMFASYGLSRDNAVGVGRIGQHFLKETQ